MKVITAVASTLWMASNVEGAFITMKDMKDMIYEDWYAKGVLGVERKSVVNSAKKCVDGTVLIDNEAFNCSEVDFLSYISLQDMDIDEMPHMTAGIRASDIWGWLSPDKEEITIICLDNGVAFVDTTDAEDPCIIATLASPRPADTWCDIKVYKDTAYIVKDTRGGDSPTNTHIGGQVFDLLRLKDLTKNGCPATPVVVDHDFLWNFHGSSHNLIINTDTGYLYSVGTDYCKGGIIAIDLNKNRLEPEYAGCFDGDNYTHDAQCVIYTGPDKRFTGKEICFAFNEDTLTIWDVTDKSNGIMLSRLGYPGQVYTHQGWLTEDMSTVIMDDELNELCSGDPGSYQSTCDHHSVNGPDGITRTSTLVVDVKTLDAPIYVGKYLHKDNVVDHNLYVWGSIHKHGWGGNAPMKHYPNLDFAYLHNYESGLQILNISTHNPDTFDVVGYFDVAPNMEGLSFLGSWSGYLHPSGAYAISSVERGLFMVKPRMAFVGSNEENDESDSGTDGVKVAGIALIMIGAAILVSYYALVQSRKAKEQKAATESEELVSPKITHYEP